MAKIVYLIFSLLLIATIAFAADEEERASKGEASCSPWLGYCRTYEGCCRHLTCMSYLGKCVPIGGLVIPGKDKRPVGPGPFPPGYIA